MTRLDKTKLMTRHNLQAICIMLDQIWLLAKGYRSKTVGKHHEKDTTFGRNELNPLLISDTRNIDEFVRSLDRDQEQILQHFGIGCVWSISQNG